MTLTSISSKPGDGGALGRAIPMPRSRWRRATTPELQQLPAAARSRYQRAMKAFETAPQRQPAGAF